MGLTLLLVACNSNQANNNKSENISNQKSITMNQTEKNLKTVKVFYSKVLTNPSALSEEEFYNIISKDLVSIPTPPAGEGAEGMFNSVKYFGQVIPNLSWEPQEILQDGNKYTVRSLVKGTPTGPFFSVETATGKSFETMSIDILTVEDGKVVHSYHLEDWTTAISQLTSK